MDGWMDRYKKNGWLNKKHGWIEKIDGWMDEWLEKKIDGCTERKKIKNNNNIYLKSNIQCT